jgi:PrtD family type I secretion system ABC transporter
MLRSPARAVPTTPRSELATALTSCRGAIVGIGLFSGLSNVLMLTGAFFMLQIYDRVLPSRSVPTLVGLAMLAGGLYIFQGVLDAIRGRVLTRIAITVDDAVSERVFEVLVHLALKAGMRHDGLQPLRDLDSIRSFLSGQGPIALFDLPWIPLYLAICFALHFLIGVVALCGALVLAGLASLTEMLTRGPIKGATSFGMVRNGLAETSRRNAEVLIAMGMAHRMQDRWSEANRNYIINQQHASDVGGGLVAVSKVLRMMLQSGLLAVGAFLVIHQEATAGVIIAGSILGARALGPVDLAIANWRGFVAARQSWARMSQLLARLPAHPAPMPLHSPCKSLSVETASGTPPGETKLVIQDISFLLKSGQALGIIGPSASGKSSLLRLLVGIWLPVRGKIRLDGAALDQWAPEALGRHIGYLPQDVELLAGSVAQNVARFEPEADPQAVIAAANAAGVHDLIINLPEGYETQVGEQGSALSAGQRQWIALARALYRDPFLVVLDEPNSNLDSLGEDALMRAIVRVRSRGGIVIVVAHRPSAIAGVDLVMVLNHGRIQAFGPREEVLAKVLRRDSPAARPLKVVPDGGITS